MCGFVVVTKKRGLAGRLDPLIYSNVPLNNALFAKSVKGINARAFQSGSHKFVQRPNGSVRALNPFEVERVSYIRDAILSADASRARKAKNLESLSAHVAELKRRPIYQEPDAPNLLSIMEKKARRNSSAGRD